MARLSRRLWGGTSLKTAAKEVNCTAVSLKFLSSLLVSISGICSVRSTSGSELVSGQLASS